MSKLSKREKLLIYFFCCFTLTVVASFLVLMPIIQSDQLVQLSIDAEQDYFDEMIRQRDEIPLLQQQHDILFDIVSENAQRHMLVQPNENLENLITTMLISNQLTPLEVLISEPSETEVLESADSYFQTVSMSTTFVGSQGNVVAMINDMTATHDIRIDKYEVYLIVEDGYYRANVNFSVVMAAPLER